MDVNLITVFHDIKDFHFNDKSLLRRALTHPSYLNENPDFGIEDNQRLEFLGDAVLDFISGELLYHRFPEAPEGRLTRLRAALVRKEMLAEFARIVNLNEFMLLGHGEEENKGRIRDGNLCNTFEALIGAIYLDKEIDAVRELVSPLFNQALEEILKNDLDKDAKSRLQEFTQRHLGCTPVYETIDSSGPDHAKIFKVAVILNDVPYADGTGSSKQSAAQKAAIMALTILKDSN